jgi:hypothetical protein
MTAVGTGADEQPAGIVMRGAAVAVMPGPACTRCVAARQVSSSASARKDGEWRCCTVWPPALLTFAALCFSILEATVTSAMNCFDTCYPIGGGMA